MRTITQISTDDRHIYALCSDGSIWEKDRYDADWNLIETPFTSSSLPDQSTTSPQCQGLNVPNLRKRLNALLYSPSSNPSHTQLLLLAHDIDSALKSLP